MMPMGEPTSWASCALVWRVMKSSISRQSGLTEPQSWLCISSHLRFHSNQPTPRRSRTSQISRSMATTQSGQMGTCRRFSSSARLSKVRPVLTTQ